MTHASPETKVAPVVEHLFRHESGRLTAMLARRFGPARLALVEDAVQDALLRAMQTWPLSGVPDNPTGWLLRAARNRLLDEIRRETRWREKEPEVVALLDDEPSTDARPATPRFEDEVSDNQLRMMFVCCHPDLPAETQVALTLKTLCGFGEREIAAALLAREDAITKRLVRARRLLRECGITLELPPAADLEPRRRQVLHVLYLLFNEGYKATAGDELVRADLCAEAIRLGELLGTQPAGAGPETHALLALMYLHHARRAERLDPAGELRVLDAQDRSRWDRTDIAHGARHLAASATGERTSRYHLEAGIAACHVLAPDDASTDWPRIRSLYDELLVLDASPVVAVNRAVAIARCDGAAAGLAALSAIADQGALARYHFLHAVAAELKFEIGDMAGAVGSYEQALKLATVPAERRLLERRLERCAPGGLENQDR